MGDSAIPGANDDVFMTRQTDNDRFSISRYLFFANVKDNMWQLQAIQRSINNCKPLMSKIANVSDADDQSWRGHMNLMEYAMYFTKRTS